MNQHVNRPDRIDLAALLSRADAIKATLAKEKQHKTIDDNTRDKIDTHAISEID